MFASRPEERKNYTEQHREAVHIFILHSLHSVTTPR